MTFCQSDFWQPMLVSTRSTLTTLVTLALILSCSTEHRDTERLWPCLTLRVNKKRSHPPPPAGGEAASTPLLKLGISRDLSHPKSSREAVDVLVVIFT